MSRFWAQRQLARRWKITVSTITNESRDRSLGNRR
jgi:hypothetical protein